MTEQIVTTVFCSALKFTFKSHTKFYFMAKVDHKCMRVSS